MHSEDFRENAFFAQLISTFLVVTFLGVAALLTVSSASAQTTTKGSIEGTLDRRAGAAVAGVTVTATGQGGGDALATTNDEGFFRILNLQPGQYTVRVEAGKGFAQFEATNLGGQSFEDHERWYPTSSCERCRDRLGAADYNGRDCECED